MNIHESILDMPKDNLDGAVWQKQENPGDKNRIEFSLTQDADQKISRIIAFLKEKTGLDDASVNITGSITSNSYSDDSDIDLHFSCDDVQDPEGKNEELRTSFEEFKAANEDDAWHIGDHPVEVYFQPNKFQDLMSVGCYSFTDKKWLVGPEFISTDFNPYAEYYDKDMRQVNKIIGDIRSIILEVNEKALVAGKLEGQRRDNLVNDIRRDLEKAAVIFQNARKTRKHLSDPASEEEAKLLRNDKRWKIADSAFKLLDKFGYLAILREFTKMTEEQDDDIDRIVDVVRKNLGPDNKKLHEVDEDETTGDKVKAWIDDIREVPAGYIWFKSTDDFIAFIEDKGPEVLEVIDIDHDAGDFQKDGGDYIRCLDFLEFIGAKDLKIRIHSANAVGIQNMRRIIKKNEMNGWKEVFDIIKESARSKVNVKNLSPEEYVKYLLDRLGADPKYSPNKTYDDMLDSVAHEYILEQPTDTAAREVEMDAAILLLRSGDKDAIEAGKNLGEAIVKNKGKKKLLQVMQEAYFALLDLNVSGQSVNENDVFEDLENINEGLKGKMLSIAALTSILTIPGITSADEMAKYLKDVPKAAMVIDNPEVQNAIVKSAANEKKGPLSKVKTINAVARTLYAEARGEGEDGQDAVASVIWNRAGGDPAKFIEVISAHKQFSCWNGYSEGWTENKFTYTVPFKARIPGSNRKIWEHCLDVATKMFNGQFKSTIGDFNSYMNKKTADKSNVESWGKQCKFKLGKHHFGYLSYHDGWKKAKIENAEPKGITYEVKAGDSLSSIAAKNDVSVNLIMKLNGIKDKNKIKIGQKLKL